MSPVRYPLAIDNGQLVWIEAAEHGIRYRCIGCDQRVVARQGAKKAWHFAHYVATSDCEPDDALHRAAQEVIRVALTRAEQQRERYEVWLQCADCPESRAFDLVVPSLSVQTEHSFVPRVRSDLAVLRPEQVPLAIEVVVTHDLEPDTESRYLSADVPVFVVRPTWDTLRNLERGITPSRTVGVQRVRCDKCRRTERRRSDLDQWTAEKLSRLDARLSHRRRGLPFRPWRHDRFGDALFGDARSRIHAAALILTELGFRQTRHKPWLFSFRIDPERVVFANLGSTEVIPIWEEPSAHVHWQFVKTDGDTEAALISGAFVRLRAANVPVRTSFYHSGFDPDPDAPTPDARQHVDPALLDRLLQAPES